MEMVKLENKQRNFSLLFYSLKLFFVHTFRHSEHPLIVFGIQRYALKVLFSNALDKHIINNGD